MLRLICLILGALRQVAAVLLHLSVEFVQNVHFTLAALHIGSELLCSSHDFQGFLLESLDLLDRMTFIVILVWSELVKMIEMGVV